jgi:AmmeMemoRadiSam system protein B
VVVPERVIVLCPNHTGMGVRRSLWAGGAWRLPGGAIEVDGELAARVRRRARLEPDLDAHVAEHAIEVHLPFLRHRNASARIVPIVLAGLSLAECREVGEGLARAIAETRAQHGGDVLLVASTDMSHYVPADEARALDGLALARVEALDPGGLYEVVRARDISMCGFIPTTCALFAARALGATRAELVRYGNSGDVSGDHERVVGYAGVVVR